jgi:hypothetical protein
VSAEAVGRFLDEAGFRCVLAYHVLAGKVPVKTKKRYWNRRFETPVLVELYSWVDDRRIASTLIWPSTGSEAEDAAYDHTMRVEQLKEVLLRGATEMAWSTRLEVDYGLQWDPDRKVWTCSDGFAYDGWRPTDSFARQPSGQDQEPGRGHTSGAVLLSLGRPVPDSEAREPEEAS